MQLASSDLEQWPSVIGHVSSLMDLDASARLHGALVRKRGVRHAADLLHLGLLYGPGGLSLRAVAGHATEAGIADLCDVSLLDRLRNAGGFFADVLDHVLADRRGDPNCEGRVGLSLVDGSTVSLPGSAGSDWRLHARYETAVGRFTDLVITEARTAEARAAWRCGPAMWWSMIAAMRGSATSFTPGHRGRIFSLGSAGARSGCSILQARASIFSPRCLTVVNRWRNIRCGSAMPATASRRV